MGNEEPNLLKPGGLTLILHKGAHQGGRSTTRLLRRVLRIIELLRGGPRTGDNFTSLFEVLQDPLFKASKAPFLTLRVATV